LPEEPDAGEGPVALDGAGRDVEDLSDLFDREAAEVAELDDAGLAGVVGGEAGEGLIDGGDFFEAVGRNGEVVVHLDAVEAAGATLGIVLACVVNEDLTHDVGGKADKVGAAVPVDVFASEAEIGFVDERGGLESVVGALATHIGLGESVEFGINEREEALGGGGVAVVHSFEELSYFSWLGIGHAAIVERVGGPRGTGFHRRGRITEGSWCGKKFYDCLLWRVGAHSSQ